jgi:uncharacterized protein with FMN-binding domain
MYNLPRRSIFAVMMAAAALPVGSAWASSPAKATHANKTYKGRVVNMQWGPVQVSIVVKGKRKIVDVKATAPTHRAQSAQINNLALPLLRAEVLQAQNAKISTVSGATLTYKAYVASLKGALKAAKIK